MKIDGQYSKAPVQDKTVPKGKEKESPLVEKKKMSELKQASTQTLTINKIRDQIEAEPDLNLEKVKEIKDKLKKGTYQVDTQKLADNLIRNSLIEDI